MEEKGDDDDSCRPSFLEVFCKSSGKVRRFAAGTEAGFALHVINCTLGLEVPQALHIVSIKEGEEPVTFGPNAALVNYGKDWKLTTVTGKDYEEAIRAQQMSWHFPGIMRSNIQSARKPTGSSSMTNSQYIGKILVAFALIFVLGGILTGFLENLPKLILFLTHH